MVVYRLRADPKFQGIVPCRTEDWDLLAQLRGQPIRSWRSLRVRIPAEEQNLLPGDCPSLATHVPVFSERARTVLAPVLAGRGDFLEMSLDGEPYWAFNVTDVRDALDESRSIVKRFKNGRIMDVVNFSFIEYEVRNAIIFRLFGLEEMDVFVTDRFVAAVDEAALTGLRAEPVWRSGQNFK